MMMMIIMTMIMMIIMVTSTHIMILLLLLSYVQQSRVHLLQLWLNNLAYIYLFLPLFQIFLLR